MAQMDSSCRCVVIVSLLYTEPVVGVFCNVLNLLLCLGSNKS